MNLFSEAHIQRIYAQGADAVVRLVHRLVDHIADLEAQLIRSPQPVIAALSKELIKLKRTLSRKTDELIRARQLNHQLLRRLRELEHAVECSTPPTPQRDSHNSSLPPSLDLPWQKIKRTRSLRQAQRSQARRSVRPSRNDAQAGGATRPDHHSYARDLHRVRRASSAQQHAHQKRPPTSLRPLGRARQSHRTPRRDSPLCSLRDADQSEVPGRSSSASSVWDGCALTLRLSSSLSTAPRRPHR